jgi:hypothetical protein
MHPLIAEITHDRALDSPNKISRGMLQSSPPSGVTKSVSVSNQSVYPTGGSITGVEKFEIVEL